MVKGYVFFAEGFEEVEALTVVDLMRRAEIKVDMVSITGERTVTGAHGIAVKMDALLEEIAIEEAEALILPGGMPGTRNLQKCEPLVSSLVAANKEGKLICAICAAPLVLGQNQILAEKKACCYPGFEEELLQADVSYEPVCHDGNVITSRGMGTAIAFASEIIATLMDAEKAKAIEKGILYSA